VKKNDPRWLVVDSRLAAHPVHLKGLDHGIRTTVWKLRSYGVRTVQSCEGGRGHSSTEPYVQFTEVLGLVDGTGHAAGMYAMAIALSAAKNGGLKPMELLEKWGLWDGHPGEHSWEITFYPPVGTRWPWYWPGVPKHEGARTGDKK